MWLAAASVTLAATALAPPVSAGTDTTAPSDSSTPSDTASTDETTPATTGDSAVDTTSESVAGTTGGSTAATTPTASTEELPPPGPNTDREVIVGAVLEPTSLDIVTVAGAALDQVLLDNVYETLLAQDPVSGDIIPGLAELPDISDDGLTWTFTLHDGVTFQSGEPLTSADVVWSLDALRAEGANEASQLASIESVEATDDLTVVVTLSQRDNSLEYQLTRRAGAVLQADATALEDSANGTGPFSLDTWNVGSSITLARNDDYSGEPPLVSGVTFQYFTDPNAAVNALTAGDVDLLTGVNTDLVSQFENDDDYKLTVGTTNGELTLGFNNKQEALSNVDVRHALRMAIDKDGVLDLFNGYGTLIGGPVPPTDPWYEDLTDLYPYDPDRARTLLEEAGYGDGLALTFVVPNIYPENIAEYVRSQLADVGVDVTIESVEFSVWLDQVYTNHDYDLTMVLHVEPRDLAKYARDDYYWQYDSAQVQALIEEATTGDPADYVDTLREATRLIAEDSPADWLILSSDLIVAHDNVVGYPQNDTQSRLDASGIYFTD